MKERRKRRYAPARHAPARHAPARPRARSKKDKPVNRWRRSWWPLINTLTALTVIVVAVAALLFSPRFWVRRIVVAGAQTITREQVAGYLAIRPGTNLLRLSSGHLRQRLLADPVIEQAEVYRRLPGVVRVRIHERQPWASIKIGGVTYLTDARLVPYRILPEPRADLPLISVQGAEKSPQLGSPLRLSTVTAARQVLVWAARRGDFPVEKILVDTENKLCLNRTGGGSVLLGSPVELNQKLDTLTLLLTRPDLLGQSTERATINLIAYSAPAIRIAQKSAGETDATSPMAAALETDTERLP